MAEKISRAAIFDALTRFIAPGANSSLLTMKAVKSIELNEGRVHLSIGLADSLKEHWPLVQTKLAEAISSIRNVKGVDIDVEWEPSPGSEKCSLAPFARHVVVVGSGKGGVGKSTIAANLACALAAKGRSIGLLDADLHGPSMGMMFGVGEEDGPVASPDGKISPVKKFGLKIMSMGFLIEEERPVIWRGPMLHKAVEQFITEVDWGELDILLIDLPPGTGDVQISVINCASVEGAVVVSTPQDVAFLDAKKAISMFNSVNVPILGVIENMSGFICPDCGSETRIFGHGGVKKAALSMGLPFLGELPIDLRIRSTCDQGTPITAISPDSPQSRAFRVMAEKMESSLGLQ